MESNNRFKRIYKLEIMIAICMVLPIMLGRCIWYDEAFSIQMAQQSFVDILNYTISDVHPPLYYFILKIVTVLLGKNFLAYRVVSLIPFAIMIVVFGQVLHKKYGYKAACEGILLFLGAPKILVYAVEIRMYSWCMLMVLCSFLLACDIWEEYLREKVAMKKWICLSIINVLAAYLHYFAGAAVILISIGLLGMGMYKKRSILFVKQWIVSMGITFILYIPWLRVFLEQLQEVRQDYWITGFRIHDLKNYAEMVIGTDTGTQLLVGTLVAVAIFIGAFYWDDYKDIVPFYGGILLVVYVVLGIALSVLITPVFVPRYTVIVLPIFWLAFGIAIFQWRNKWKYWIVGVSACLLFILSYRDVFEMKTSEYNYSAYYYLESEMESSDYILTSSSHVLGQMSVYFPEKTTYILEEALSGEKFQQWNTIANVNYLNTYDDLDSDEDGWLVLYEDEYDTIKNLREKGMQLEYQGNYTLGWDGGCINTIIYKISK